MQVVACVELPGERVECIVERAALERRIVARDRAVGHAADGEPQSAIMHDRRAGDDGEIAVAPAEFAERMAMTVLPTWKAHGFDQLVVRPGSCHQTGEEIGGRHLAAAALARLSRRAPAK